ncbi:MAG: DEAD/DEAH box helicase family protein [Candidatus ainarchaeum sp.]|nr:DEAD/DEAH box helicase family protein [Candidatus ainarchaeum sp.]
MSELVDRIVSQMGLSRRQPQEVSLKKLATICDQFNFYEFDYSKESLERIETISQVSAVPGFKFETQFPSYTFALATGVGKTRLMGSCIYYLNKKQEFKNFLIVVKGETLFEKLKTELDPNNKTDRYLFFGLSDMFRYNVILPDDFKRALYRFDENEVNIFIINVEKFAAKKDARKFYAPDEELGLSQYKLLTERKLAVMLDESHRYKAEVSFNSVNDLKPRICLEFTATPITTGATPKRFKNILHEFRLKDAISKGYVKIPRVIAWRNDELSSFDESTFERAKIARGLRQHERKRELIREYCEQNALPLVTPFVLISAKDTEHASGLRRLIGTEFPYYATKTIEIHSKTENEDDIQKFLELERLNNPDATEIVIHVNKLKEGWDVKNLYTLIPLRETASEILAEQTLGRGLRLPFTNQRTGNEEIDTFEVISHEKYEEIVQKAKKEYGEEIIVQTADEEKPELVTSIISPDGTPESKMRIPQVSFAGTTEIKDFRAQFHPKLSHDKLVAQDVEIIGTQLGIIGKEDELINIIKPEIGKYGSPEEFLFRKILRYVTELNVNDKMDLEFARRVANEYVALLRKQHSAEDINRILVNHFRKIMVDISNQISIAKTGVTRNRYVTNESAIEFRVFQRKISKDKPEIAREAASTQQECVDRVIAGYQKSIFRKNIFDSREEKLFSDILEKDGEVVKWVKPPLRQSPITYENIGLKDYNPDFFVECRKNHHYIVEIKRADEINLSDKSSIVMKKAKAALDWCADVSRETGDKWEYKLIPSTEVKPHLSFYQAISAASSLPFS